MPRPIPIYNTDGTLNIDGSITEYVEMRMIIQDHIERIRLAVSNIGRNEVFIGHERLHKHNPSVDWRKSTIIFDRCPRECGSISSLEDLDGDKDLHMPGIENSKETGISLENGERLFAFDVNEYMARRIATCVEDQTPEDKVLEERVPQRYHEYKDVFSEKEFDQLPPRRIWDHAIELTPGFKPVDCKIYPMNQEQNRLLEEFIEENIRTGRIRPSKLPMASPFFFSMKPDQSGFRPIQDYRKLNEVTVKNRYPLPLIGELIDKLKGAKYYTKLDV
jgi:hypothetical protein